jgi:hypothetical protein
MKEVLIGKCPKNEKRFAVINTISYNDDGEYCVNVCQLDKLEDLGFEINEIEAIDNLKIGERWYGLFYELSVQVIRLG